MRNSDARVTAQQITTWRKVIMNKLISIALLAGGVGPLCHWRECHQLIEFRRLEVLYGVAD
jgi:hypothetical protein